MTQHKSPPPSTRDRSSTRDWLSAIGTLAQAITGFIALVLAWQAFSIDTNEPKLEISSPNTLRLEFSKKYMNVFAQPTFIVKNPTKKVVIVKSMCMEIQYSEAISGLYRTFEEACRVNNDKLMTLNWTHIAKFNWDTERDISIYEDWVSDALPLPVSISSPQTPMAGFWGKPENMKKWKSDRCYRATIYALISSREELLDTSFYFKLTKQNLEGLNNYPRKAPFFGQHTTLDVLPANCHSTS
jgi:hypothetical protein